MTDPEVEDLLRATFQSREVQAPPLSRVRPKPRRTPWMAAGAGTLVVLAGAIVAANAVRGPAPVTLNAPPASPTAGDENPAPGWRWESSLGAEIQVPRTWTVNEYGCGRMSANPTVVRGEGARPECLPPEPQGKEVAVITTVREADKQQKLRSAPTTVDGVSAERAVGRLRDGRYAGSITVPSRDVEVQVRTTSERLTTQIIDSLRLVEVDRLGCAATTSWPQTMPEPLAGKPALPESAPNLVLCLYLGITRLQSSTQLTGDAAAALIRAVNTVPREGRNADAPAGECLPAPPKAPDLVLLAGGAKLSVLFGGCVGRGITDGQRWSKLDAGLVAKLMAPTRAGYGVSTSLR